MAPVSVHRSLRLAGQVGVDQGGARGGACARRDHPRGRAVSARNHGELVGSRRGAVVEVRRAASLEGRALALGGARVGRGEVGVVVGAAQRHGAGHRGGVGKGGGVVHPGAGEAALGDGRETRELTVELTRKWAQVRGTCGDTETKVVITASMKPDQHDKHSHFFHLNLTPPLNNRFWGFHERKVNKYCNPLTGVIYYCIFIELLALINFSGTCKPGSSPQALQFLTNTSVTSTRAAFMLAHVQAALWDCWRMCMDIYSLSGQLFMHANVCV